MWLPEKGQKFQSWTVLDPTPVLQSKTEKVLCQCECGTIRYVAIRALRYKDTQNCGCVAAMAYIRKKATEYKDKRFGALTVQGPSSRKDSTSAYCLECLCDCGNTCYYSPYSLETGSRVSCGCRITKPSSAKDLTGLQSNYLTALYYTGKTNRHRDRLWRCRCKCGNEVDVAAAQLVSSEVKSCGCLSAEHIAKLSSYLDFADGTSIHILSSKKISRNNTTGVKGVYMAGGKYKAKIVIQKKQYALGTYTSLADAAAAREEIEHQIDTVLVPAYRKWKIRASLDPEWATKNPFQIKIMRTADQTLQIAVTDPQKG